jgi:hypothetical protein
VLLGNKQGVFLGVDALMAWRQGGNQAVLRNRRKKRQKFLHKRLRILQNSTIVRFIFWITP